MQLANQPADRLVELRLPPVPRSVTEARHAAADCAEQIGADSEAVQIAVAEAVGNAVIHAFRTGNRGTVELRLDREPDALVITVTDDGDGMRPNPDSPGLGFGLPLIGRVSDGVDISESEDGGTIVRMRFPAPGKSHDA